ncbi:MurR/RpiR family transcriptional regulator [Enterococcus avium]|uniref:MurR/RpiR family transcriptional regulator n=1 Tax=Enterococcus avium TaxID=33945 RepID=UPI00159D3B7D|nr:MurR/RpiR family transcriptional regulator [Enterococcus avium]NVN75464.1 SIS domain-containing protein [Enterococcus avium]
MNYQSFRMRLQKIEADLSKSEHLVASYILRHENELGSLSITELADRINTSPATITRFCKRLEYRNYNEFKTLIESELRDTDLPSDSIATITSSYEEILLESSKIIKEKQLQQFILNINNANKILVIGIGSSGLTAIEFSVRLARMGINAQSITDSYNMVAQSNLLTEGDMLIAISNSGETAEIVEAVAIASKKGANIQAISKHENSFLARTANNTYLTSQSFFISDKRFFNDQLSSLFLIDVITYLLLSDEKYNDKYQETLKVLLKKNVF